MTRRRLIQAFAMMCLPLPAVFRLKEYVFNFDYGHKKASFRVMTEYKPPVWPEMSVE